MALTESAGGAWVTGNATSVTTGSFTPSAGALLVALGCMGNGGNASETSQAVSGSAAGTWTQLCGVVVLGGGPMAGVWVKDAGASPPAQTVTYTPFTGGGGLGLIVRQFTGAAPAAQQTGVTATTASAGAAAYTLGITPQVTGSQVVGAFGRSSNSQTLTANASTSIYSQANSPDGDTEAALEAAALSVAGTGVVLGATNAPGGANVLALAEIIPAVLAGAGASDRHHRRGSW